MKDEDVDAKVRELKEKELPLEAVLDSLISDHPNQTIFLLRVVMGAYDLDLLEARAVVENRKFELEWAPFIARSEAWIEEQVAQTRASKLPVGHVVLDYLEGHSLDRTPWEPTGLVERATVLSKAFDLVFKDAVDLIVDRKVQRDAERWRKLVACGRIRILGSSNLGRPDGHLGLELWGVFPEKGQPDGAPTLTAFVDGLSSPFDLETEKEAS